jgi:hypothetical protein
VLFVGSLAGTSRVGSQYPPVLFATLCSALCLVLELKYVSQVFTFLVPFHRVDQPFVLGERSPCLEGLLSNSTNCDFALSRRGPFAFGNVALCCMFALMLCYTYCGSTIL